VKRVILFALLFTLGLSSIAQNVRLRLDSSAEISLYTCGSGDDLYSLFGHTALRVLDEANGIDRIYNYGTFSFSSDFYYKFTKGQLNYALSAYRFDSFEDEYRYDQRYIKQQVLNLTHKQKEEMFTFLEVNAMPQNRYYLYDFFYDNCSTRPRDVFEQIIPNVQYPELEGGAPSFRNMIDEYLVLAPWADFGIDLGLGAYTDSVTDIRGTMFLPEKLFDAMAKTTFDGKPAVKETVEVFVPEPRKPTGSWTDPVPLFHIFLIATIIMMLYEVRKGKLFHLFDKIFFAFLGLLGWFVLFLWLGTDHQATKANLNVFWAFPLHLPLAFWVFRKKHSRWTRIYLVSIALLALIVLIPILPQSFHLASSALAGVVLIRVVLRLYLIRKLG
jgi:hypothetical protein